MKYDVFLSHSQKDAKFTRKLAEYLRKNGLDVWLDIWRLRPGDSLVESVSGALQQSRFILIIMSPAYFSSEWTKSEWEAAILDEMHTSTIKVIPILYKDCEIPKLLSTKTWVDFRDQGQYDRSLEKLVQDIYRQKDEGIKEDRVKQKRTANRTRSKARQNSSLKIPR